MHGRPQPRSRTLGWCLIASGLALGGCEDQPHITTRPAVRTADPAPVVLVGGIPIADDQLRARTGELAGGVAIEELVLERMLADACRREGIEIDDASVEHERADLVDAVIRDSDRERVPADELLKMIRAQRGLGPVRFGALLRRNAMLRALVRDQITVGDDEVRLAHAIRTGERRIVRLIAAPTRGEAAAARARLADVPDPAGITQAFADEARRVSTHPSAPAGGSLGEVSPLDPAYPEALRVAIGETNPGELTAIFPIGHAWGFGLVERVIAGAADAELSSQRAGEIRAEIRRRRERLEMERLAERLVREAEVTVVDPSLGWSFRTRTGRGG